MSTTLLTHINQFIKLSTQEHVKILKYCRPTKRSKKEMLLDSGRLCNKLYFVEEGCLQMFFIDDKGVQRTVQFAIRNWWLTDHLAFIHQKTTDFSIQAIVPSHVIEFTYDGYFKMLSELPTLECYFRHIFQISLGAASIRLKYMFGYSKEQRYLHFVKHFPEFAQSVPQYLIASFLDLTPEYVSEIRAKQLS